MKDDTIIPPESSTRREIKSLHKDKRTEYTLKSFAYIKKKEKVSIKNSPFIHTALAKRVINVPEQVPKHFYIIRTIASGAGFSKDETINNAIDNYLKKVPFEISNYKTI